MCGCCWRRGGHAPLADAKSGRVREAELRLEVRMAERAVRAARVEGPIELLVVREQRGAIEPAGRETDTWR